MPPKRKPAPKKSGNLDKIAQVGLTIVDPFGARKLLKRDSKPSKAIMPRKKTGASTASKAADAGRKQKQAQSMAMEKVAAKKQTAVQSKRMTGAAVKSATKKKLDNKRKTGYYGG
jgi:type IV secretory pathway VirD2 relaxase